MSATPTLGGEMSDAFDVGVWFQSAASGMWYQSKNVSGDVSAVKVDGVIYKVSDSPPHDGPPLGGETKGGAR